MDPISDQIIWPFLYLVIEKAGYPAKYASTVYCRSLKTEPETFLHLESEMCKYCNYPEVKQDIRYPALPHCEFPAMPES